MLLSCGWLMMIFHGIWMEYTAWCSPPVKSATVCHGKSTQRNRGAKYGRSNGFSHRFLETFPANAMVLSLPVTGTSIVGRGEMVHSFASWASWIVAKTGWDPTKNRPSRRPRRFWGIGSSSQTPVANFSREISPFQSIPVVVNMTLIVVNHLTVTRITGWWFGCHFLFSHSVGNNHPNWRTHIFQRGGPTTNQIMVRKGNHPPTPLCLVNFEHMFYTLAVNSSCFRVDELRRATDRTWNNLNQHVFQALNQPVTLPFIGTNKQ